MSRPMRGFLGFVVLLLAALAVSALVVVPAIVRPLVVDAVRDASPFGDQPIEVEVDVDPVALMLGTIERIRVTGAGLEAEGAQIAGLDLTLTDVSTSTRTFRAISGRLSGVALPFVQSSTLVIDTIELSGASDSIGAVARLDPRATLAVIGNAFADSGIAVESLELADGGIAMVLFGQRVAVPVAAEDGALVLPDVGGGPLVVVEPGPDDRWRIAGVTMSPTGMDVVISFDQDGGVPGART